MDAVDISLWSVRHVCLLEVPAISAGGAAACLAEYLAKQLWLCDAQLVEVGKGALKPLLEAKGRPRHQNVKDLEHLDPARCQPRLLLLSERLLPTALLKCFAERRSPKRTRLLVAHDDLEPAMNEFLQEALQQGFTFHVLARHQSETTIGIYAIDWNEPSLHISSFQDAVSIALRFPTAWAAETSEMVQRCEIWTSEHEICFAAEDFGWRKRAKLPREVDVNCEDNWCKWRKTCKTLEIKLRCKRSLRDG